MWMVPCFVCLTTDIFSWYVYDNKCTNTIVRRDWYVDGTRSRYEVQIFLRYATAILLTKPWLSYSHSHYKIQIIIWRGIEVHSKSLPNVLSLRSPSFLKHGVPNNRQEVLFCSFPLYTVVFGLITHAKVLACQLHLADHHQRRVALLITKPPTLSSPELNISQRSFCDQQQCEWCGRLGERFSSR